MNNRGDKLRGLAQALATFRHMAALVASGAPPEELFAAFADELGPLLPGEAVAMGRYLSGGELVPVAAWGREARPADPGQVLSAARFDVGAKARAGNGFAVSAPFRVEGRLWGVMVAYSAAKPLPANAKKRLSQFAELMATVIANAESRAALAASRARIVAASDETRRRIERDLHDGAQQRLVSLALELRAAQAAVPAEFGQVRSELDEVAEGMAALLDELRTISRGIHPAVLDTGGLAPAVKALARRSAVPVFLSVLLDERLPEGVEVAAYYVVSEALTNVAKHARGSSAQVEVERREKLLYVSVRDNGKGGADPARGTGLVGLRDRVEALGGSLSLDSPTGGGTLVQAVLPVDEAHLPAERSRVRSQRNGSSGSVRT